MARKHSKRKKQQKKQQHEFYETLAIGMLPGPDMAAGTGRDAATTVAQYAQQTAKQLQEWGLDAVLGAQTLGRWGVATAKQFSLYRQQAWTLLRPELAAGRQTLAGGAVTSLGYGRAAAADLERAAHRLRRGLWSRRMRRVYLMLLVISGIGVAAVAATVAAATIAAYSKNISSPAAIMDAKKTGITILDRNGQVLFQGYGAQTYQPVALNDMPADLKNATLAAEDPTFYSHQGFSWKATARAAWVDIADHGTVEGGSTLTQQLVKNALLNSDKTFERKYQEVVLATELESKYSKDQIFDMYLNETYYGQGSNGVESASETYFHKPVQDLDLSQSALLAGLPLGPSRFDPTADLSAATGRRDYVLDRMVQLGKITPAQANAAKAEPIVAYPKTITIQAPHFVFYVLDQLRTLYGENAIENNGMTVTTTLDLTKQNAAQQIVQNQVAKLSAHHVSNGGLISIEPGTGDIIAMVGSIGYDTPGFGAVNITTSQLQPGSSFKPFAYVTAFEKGWNGSTEVQDEPVEYPNGDGTMYVPEDYDLRWRGTVTLRRALANSLNIPAIHVLQYAGIPDTLATAKAMGITTLGPASDYGLSLVLGAGDVTPIDMATAYSVFANGGTKVEPRSILKVTDRSGKDITKDTQTPPQKVLDPRYAYMITSILSDNRARTEEFGANSPLLLDRPDAAKTGTTNDFKDNWTVGYTPNLTTAVWVGNNDHTAMQNVDGITGAAPIWHDYMEMALSNMPVENFTMPAGDTAGQVCAADGGLANPWDTNTYTEVWPTGQPLTRQCGSSPLASAFQAFTSSFTDPGSSSESTGTGNAFTPIIETRQSRTVHGLPVR